MTFKTHCQMSKGMVDPAPLVNVVFLLLLFFVLNSSLVMQSGFGVSLPGAGNTTLTGTFQTLVVTVARDDLLFFNDQPVPMDKLEQTLREAAQRTRVHELIIRADKQVSIGTETEIWNAATRAGIATVIVAARPEGPAASPSN
jgi:biopolymer transport protein ExbD